MSLGLGIHGQFGRHYFTYLPAAQLLPARSLSVSFQGNWAGETVSNMSGIEHIP